MKTLFNVSPPVVAEFCPNLNQRPIFAKGGNAVQDDFIAKEYTRDNMDAPCRIPTGSTVKTSGYLEGGVIRHLIFPNFIDRGAA